MIRGNNVSRILKQRGYRYILLDSAVPPADESPLADKVIRYPAADGQRPTIKERYEYLFSQLMQVSTGSEPKFVFAYLVSPQSAGAGSDFPEGADFFDTLLSDIITKILKRAHDSSVIIIQGATGAESGPDEGSPNHKFAENNMTIYEAFYIPHPIQKRLYPSITPVNTFRFVLDGIFKTDLGLLEDRIYYAHPKSPFEFTEISRTAEQ